MRKLFFMFLFWTAFTQYSNANILLSDTYIKLNQNIKSKAIEVTNTSKKHKLYRTSFINYLQLSDGSYKKAKNDQEIKFAKPFLHMSPRSFSLKPRETQTIRLFKKNAAFQIAETGEYRSHLLISEVENLDAKKNKVQSSSEGMRINISALMGMSIPVILQKGHLSHPTPIVSSKVILKDKTPHLKVTLLRKGSSSSRGDLDIFLGDQKIGIARNINIFAPLKKRILTIRLYQDSRLKTTVKMSSLKNKTLTIYYNEQQKDKKNTTSKFSHKVDY